MGNSLDKDFELKKHVWKGKQFFELPISLFFGRPLKIEKTLEKGFRKMEKKAIVPNPEAMMLFQKHSPFKGSFLVELKGEESGDPSVKTFANAVVYSKVHEGKGIIESLDQLRNFVKIREGTFPSELFFWNREKDTVIFGKV